MLPGGHEVHPLRRLQRDHRVAAVDARIQLIHQVHVVLSQRAEHIGRGGGGHDHLHLRIELVIAPQHLGKADHAQRLSQRDAQLPGHARSVVHLAAGVLGHAQDVLRVAVKPRPLLGQRDAAPHPIEQTCAQLFLQLSDLHGDGRLGVVQLPRGRRE